MTEGGKDVGGLTLNFLFFCFLLILAVTPKAATPTNWLREDFGCLRGHKDYTSPIAGSIPAVPLPLTASFLQSHQIEWGSNFIWITHCLDYKEPLLLDKTVLWVGWGWWGCSGAGRKKDTWQTIKVTRNPAVIKWLQPDCQFWIGQMKGEKHDMISLYSVHLFWGLCPSGHEYPHTTAKCI